MGKLDKMDKLRGAIGKNDNASVERAMNAIINNEIRESVINFSYEKLSLPVEDLEELQEHEKALLMQGKTFNKVSTKIGEHLVKAREIFIKSHSESFVEWYEALGLSKDQVTVFTSRYRYTLEYPESKEKILSLSDRIIRESINKKNPENIFEKVLKGELTTAIQIKKEREQKNNSIMIEKISEIEEAEIVEKKVNYSEFEKIFVEIGMIFTDLEDELLKNGGSANQLKIAKQMLEIAKKLK